MYRINDAEQVAWILTRSKDKSSTIAFLRNKSSVYYSRLAQNSGISVSAVSTLIQGIYNEFPEYARQILRNRIFATTSPQELCLGMVKVAAKRLTAPVDAVDHQIPVTGSLIEITYELPAPIPEPPFLLNLPPAPNDGDFMKLAIQLAMRHAPQKQLHQSDRPVAAILVSSDHQILSWATNSNSRNKTLHAEIKLIQNYYAKTRQLIPKFSKIYTTLKPCKMCAGMIWSSAEDIGSLKIFYSQYDHGSLAQSTLLNLNSQERIRASRNNHQLKCNIEIHLNPI